jgi:sulfur carrier protein
MTVRMTLRKKVYEVKAGMTIRDAILKLDIIPESVLPVKNGELLTDDEILEDGDEIKLVAVISGG